MESRRVIVFGSHARSLVNFRFHMLKAISSRGHNVIAIAPEPRGEIEKIRDKLKAIDVYYYPVALSRTGTNPFEDAKTFIKLIHAFRKYRPDLLLSYTIKPVIYGSLAACISGVSSVNSMITGLGSSLMSSKRGLVNRSVDKLYQQALNCNMKVFFQNKDDYQEFVQRGFLRNPGKAVFINGSGVDLDYFNQSPLPQKENISFLLIARLIRDKGIIEYVRAAKIIKRRYPNVIFKLVGPFDTNPTALNPQEIREWHSEGTIQYLGEQSDVRDSIRGSDVYVLPSYREGTPRSVLEAMAIGRPIITTDAPGCRETVVEGENGFMIRMGDVDSLVMAMEKFIRSPQIAISMGEASRKLVEKKYNVHLVNKVILDSLEL